MRLRSLGLRRDPTSLVASCHQPTTVEPYLVGISKISHFYCWPQHHHCLAHATRANVWIEKESNFSCWSPRLPRGPSFPSLCLDRKRIQLLLLGERSGEVDAPAEALGLQRNPTSIAWRKWRIQRSSCSLLGLRLDFKESHFYYLAVCASMRGGGVGIFKESHFRDPPRGARDRSRSITASWESEGIPLLLSARGERDRAFGLEKNPTSIVKELRSRSCRDHSVGGCAGLPASGSRFLCRPRFAHFAWRGWRDTSLPAAFACRASMLRTALAS